MFMRLVSTLTLLFAVVSAKSHDHLPTWVCCFCNGRLLVGYGGGHLVEVVGRENHP